MADKIRGHMLILDSDSDLLQQVPGLELPTVDKRSYALVDNDEQVCRVIMEDEFDAAFVDNNIDTFRLLDIDLLTLDVDKQYVTLTYTNGNQATILVGSIDLDEQQVVQEYAKRGGVIYPIDDSGHVQFDKANTPNLVAVREWYLKEAKRVNDERVEIAEMVHHFADCIGELGHAGHLGLDMTQPVTTDGSGHSGDSE